MPLTLVNQKTQSPADKSKLPGGKKPETPGEHQSFDLAGYFKGVIQEWHKITWPGRTQVIAETVIVLVVVTVFSLFVFGIDKILQFLIQLIT